MNNLLERITAFMRLHEMADSRFGELAVKDRKLVSQIRGGRDLRYSTIARIEAFMDGYQPDQKEPASSKVEAQ